MEMLTTEYTIPLINYTVQLWHILVAAILGGTLGAMAIWPKPSPATLPEEK